MARFLFLIIVSAILGLAQTSAFEVVSVKPSPPAATMSRTTWEPNRLVASGVNLKQLIEWAYQITDVQVSGGPGWLESKYFDVEAKAETGHARDELLLMLQPVLADRFKLQLHHEMKQLPAYVLAAGPNRGELHDAKGGAAYIQIQNAPEAAGNTTNVQIIGQSVSMRYLTSYLTGSLGRLVVDRTSLNGSFDFKVDVPLESHDDLTDKQSALSMALLNAIPKLGLKLDSKRESVDVLVVDSAAEPAPN